MSLATRPSWLTPTDFWIARAQKEAPNFTLPEGKQHFAVRKRTDITSDSIVGKASVNAVMDTAASNEKQINWIHSSIWGNSGKSPATSGQAISQLTQQDCENVAMTLPLCYAEANEIYEGNPWGSSDHHLIQFRWFYNKRRAMYAAANNGAGLPYRNYGTYGAWDVYNGDPWQYQTGDGSNKAPNDPFFKAKIASVSAARASCDYFTTREPEGVGAIIKHYADQINYASRYYNKAFAAEVMALGMGATPGIPPAKLIFVMWPHIEGLNGNDGFQHNGYYVDRRIGNVGTVRTFNKHPQIDYDYLVGNVFCIGFCRTIGYLPFDERTHYGVDPMSMRSGDSNSTWMPFVNGTPAPETADGYPDEPMRWHDAGPEAAYYYSLCTRTAGEPWRYCRYQEEGSGWVDPKTDGTTILEHASANDGAYSVNGRRGRADAMYRVKGSALDVWVFDPSRPKNSKKTITLEPLPGKQIQLSAQGSKLYLYNETI
ncbi:hypothetical protein [Spirosoma pollinicola]|uniref:DUF4038 domain-containing protein n=1 Tax=Spirosoma pollinicola TaxID=2057025 RepID=A0A2K8YTH1_9BACT|nr:hypothetical protein [Spirosoma pollinicola]AUD00923.1 hypothetical protein CWM47_03295 [Spirosoma pollinicola]